MDELVKRLRNEAENPDNYPEDSILMREAADAIEELDQENERLPAADVRPVVRGRWIADKKRLWFTCSVCGEDDMLENHRNFCPNCGADMRQT